MRRRNVGISTFGGLVNIVALPDHPAGSVRQLGPFNVSRRVVGGVAAQYHEIVSVVETQLQVGDGAVPAWVGFLQQKRRAHIAKQLVHRHGGQMHFLGLTVPGHDQRLVAALLQANQVGNALAHPLGCVGLGLAFDGVAV